MWTYEAKETYENIKDKAVIIFDKEKATDELLKSKSVILYYRDGYAHTDYLVLSNPHKLSDYELALFCDGGNLCFGYRVMGSLITIHTD